MLWVRGHQTMSARNGHTHNAGRERTTDQPMMPSGMAHQRIFGSQTNGRKRNSATGGYSVSTLMAASYAPAN